MLPASALEPDHSCLTFMSILQRIVSLPFIATLTLGFAAPAFAARDAAADAPARAAFRAAYARALTTPADDAQDSAELKSYVLYPYLQAARIRRALESPAVAPLADRRAADFIAAHAELPVERNVRRDWLDSLARRSQWPLFLEAYQDTLADDALRCQSYTALIELDRTADLAEAIARQWLTPRGLPECDRAFAWLKERGALTTDLVERRTRLALEAGNTTFARQLMRDLPPDRSAPLAQWASLLEHPESGIDMLTGTPDIPVDAAALLAAWTRLARIRPDAALVRYDALTRARGLDHDAASPYALALAVALARDRNPAARDYFARVAASDLNDAALGWRARAALWSQQWDEVSASIAALSPSARATARWRYWAARAAEQLHGPEQARPLYQALLADDNFYAAMAAARMSRPIEPHPSALNVDPDLAAAMERLPALERARELFLCGLRDEADAEWRFAFRALSHDERLQSIALAASWGWYDQAVTTATAQRVFNDYVLLYPRPFDAEVKAAAHRAQLDPDLIYGVVRQESLYRTDAFSRAGARGLMQLMPETARRVAHEWRLPRPAPAALFDPRVNIALGAANLRTLLDQFDGQTPVALAGYNAGPAAAARWLPGESTDSDVWIENIPYDETREYVERVLWHSLLVRWLRNDGEAQHADSWLTAINPLRGMERETHVASLIRRRE
jgi:soluble lytic murein transglycosylase